jgi:branched-chain amino acid transport system ATP-binding protein
VTVRFGGIARSTGCRSTSRAGHIVGFIGPNGAGKTTMFNCLSRLYAFSEGRIAFEGRSLLETPPHGIAALGIGRTFQNLALFRTMSVRENVMLGGHARTRSGYVANALRLPRCGARRAASAPRSIGCSRCSSSSRSPTSP